MSKIKISNNYLALLLVGLFLTTLTSNCLAYPVILKGSVCGEGNCGMNKSHKVYHEKKLKLTCDLIKLNELSLERSAEITVEANKVKSLSLPDDSSYYTQCTYQIAGETWGSPQPIDISSLNNNCTVFIYNGGHRIDVTNIKSILRCEQ